MTGIVKTEVCGELCF